MCKNYLHKILISMLPLKITFFFQGLAFLISRLESLISNVGIYRVRLEVDWTEIDLSTDWTSALTSEPRIQTAPLLSVWFSSPHCTNSWRGPYQALRVSNQRIRYRPAAIFVVLGLRENHEGTSLVIATALLHLGKAANLTKTTIMFFKCPHIECLLHALLYDGSNPPNGYKTIACGDRQVLNHNAVSVFC
jgi:hypothetical protein